MLLNSCKALHLYCLNELRLKIGKNVWVVCSKRGKGAAGEVPSHSGLRTVYHSVCQKNCSTFFTLWQFDFLWEAAHPEPLLWDSAHWCLSCIGTCHRNSEMIKCSSSFFLPQETAQLNEEKGVACNKVSSFVTFITLKSLTQGFESASF